MMKPLWLVTKIRRFSCGKPLKTDWEPQNSLSFLYKQKPSLIELMIFWGILNQTSLKLKIDGVVKSLPNDKSLGPDGFSNEFLKRCQPIIKYDFYNLFKNLQQNIICLRGINKSYITLIPKTDGAQHTSELRPISLLNSSVKLLTKLLANRVQNFITRLFHKKPIWFHQVKNNLGLPSLVIWILASLRPLKKRYCNFKTAFWEGFWQEWALSNFNNLKSKRFWWKLVVLDETNPFF